MVTDRERGAEPRGRRGVSYPGLGEESGSGACLRGVPEPVGNALERLRNLRVESPEAGASSNEKRGPGFYGEAMDSRCPG